VLAGKVGLAGLAVARMAAVRGRGRGRIEGGVEVVGGVA
jgi:hypothetical protein